MARTTRRVLDMALGAAKNLKRFGATSWKYLKVEAVPPLTVGFFNGPAGRKLENFAGKLTTGFIGAIESRIKEMDAEAVRARLEMLAAIKAHEEKLKIEAKKKQIERFKAAEKKALEEVKKAAALAELKKAEVEAAKLKEKPKQELKGKPKKKPKGKGKGKDKSRRKKKPKKKKTT